MQSFARLNPSDARPSDPLANELCQRLFTAFCDKRELLTASNPTCKLEVEGRLGCIIDDFQSKSRIRLPIETDSILSPEYPHGFDSGIREQQFKAVKQHFYDVSNASSSVGSVEAGDGGPNAASYKTIYISEFNNKLRAGTKLSQTNGFHGSADAEGDELDTRTATNGRELIAPGGEESDSAVNKQEENDSAAASTVQEVDRISTIPEWSLPLHANTHIEYYTTNAGNSIRCSYPLRKHGADTKAAPLEVISKDVLTKCDIYVGKDVNEGEEEEHKRQLIDLRISIGIEHTKSLSDTTGLKPTHTRCRYRESFLHRSQLVRVDTTMVKSSIGQKADQYEVEVEINPDVLLEILKAGSPNASIKLYGLCSIFLSLLRKLSGLVNGRDIRFAGDSAYNNLQSNVRKRLGEELIPLRRDEDIAEYKKHVSETLPLIGDYLFRAISTEFPKLKKARKDSEEGIDHHINPYTYQKPKLKGPLLFDLNDKTIKEMDLKDLVSTEVTTS